MDFFTADLHLGHKNIVERDPTRRRFPAAEMHDQAVIANWSAVVREQDSVYVLGDSAFGSKERVHELLHALCGRIFLVRGNHDSGNVDKPGLRARFEWIKDLHYYRGTWNEEKVRIVLCHYPMLFWENSGRGVWHLFGHCHGGAPERKVLALDIGCSLHEFRPVPLPEVVEMFRTRELAGCGPTWQHELTGSAGHGAITTGGGTRNYVPNGQ